jgi:hypothetical protein
MKPICGIIVAEGKAKVEKEGKVTKLFFMLFLISLRIFLFLMCAYSAHVRNMVYPRSGIEAQWEQTFGSLWQK